MAALSPIIRPAKGGRHDLRRIAVMAAGWALIALAPVAGLLPGPGGVFVFAGGLSLVLKTSPWAQRVYVRCKRRWPRLGAWCDWGMRRPSYRRRAARDGASR